MLIRNLVDAKFVSFQHEIALAAIAKATFHQFEVHEYSQVELVSPH